MYFYWHKQKNLDECYVNKFKKNFIAPFYGWGGSTAKKLEPLRGGRYMNEKESERNI